MKIKNEICLKFTIVNLLICIACLYAYSCKLKNKQLDQALISKKQVSYSNESFNHVDSLKIAIIKKGDVKAYQELYDLYYDNNDAIGFIIWAEIMANKFNYNKAYYDVYASLQMVDEYYNAKNKSNSYNTLELLDAKDRKKALEYLILASNKGDESAKRALGEYYIEGKYLPKNITLGTKLIKESEQP